MSSFKYRFDSVLKLKERKEDEIKKECSALRTQISAETIKLKIAVDKEILMRQSILNTAASGVRTYQDLNDIRACNLYITYLKEFIDRKKDEINKMEDKFSVLQNSLLNARMEKLTFEKIKDRDEAAFGEAVAADEQKMTDEAALYTYRTHLAEIN
jgi:flagellar export protein FliJ